MAPDPSNSDNLLQVCDLSCERDGRVLFAGLNFKLLPGAALQVEGPNGAGKSTLIRTLIGSASDCQGQILWAGESLPAAQARLQSALLYIGHNPGVRRGLTPMENLAWYGAGKEEALEALAQLDLYGFEDSLCSQLSAGQTRRVALARLFLTDTPPLWILDEPLAALDVRGVARLEAQMARHQTAGGSILFTSHQPVKLQCLSRVDLGMHLPDADPLGYEEEGSYAG